MGKVGLESKDKFSTDEIINDYPNVGQVKPHGYGFSQPSGCHLQEPIQVAIQQMDKADFRIKFQSSICSGNRRWRDQAGSLQLQFGTREMNRYRC
ncbi:hypothetical protein QQP08_009380 [Theobroma cacao]|nr:hypothetical protein QQP08_009380 [Theobroma cacao]